jgi:hypothetical protein
MAGYSGTPLFKKLGMKPGIVVHVVNAPSEYFHWISPVPQNMTFQKKLSGEIGFIHLFSFEKRDFEQRFLSLKKYLRKDGMLWVSWPKKSSKIVSDLDENIVREFGLQNGLVDVKVCAVNEVWSGLKFVFRLKDR